MRCPACRAENSTGPQCRRCRADLSLLFGLEGQRRVLVGRAARAARRGDWPEAGGLAARAHALRKGPDTFRLLAAASLLRGDFAGAWCYYQGGAREADPPPTS